MPSSFSRFLSEEEMRRVRELYQQSLLDAEGNQSAPDGEQPAPGAEPNAEPER